MICLKCNNQDFLVKQDAVIEQEFRGETFRIQTPAMECSNCGWTTIDLEQADELRKRTADAYRKKHGLLTSDEIKAYRKLLRKTQREFAEFLGAGEASVKRWETWQVQEKANDNLIRMKCEKALLDQLAQKAISYDWISFQVPFTETASGVVVNTTQPETPIPSRWGVQETLPEPEAQMTFSDQTGQDTSGLPPPDRAAETAFSFSTPSPSRFQIEGVEKENAPRHRPQKNNRCIADHANHTTTVPIAA